MTNKLDRVQLSASSIKMIYEASHNWGNKIMGFKPEDHDYYHQGNEAQEIIRKHITGEKLSPDLMHLTEEKNGQKVPIHFPIMEEKDFDPRCKFSFTLKPNPLLRINQEYEIRGYVDGHDPLRKRLCEIKSSSSPWSLGQFHSLMQRKVYALGFPTYTEFIGITCLRDPSKWSVEKPKMYRMPLTLQDQREALDWIVGAIKIIESGDWTGGLDENGKCTNPRCYYGVNCQFK